MPSADSLGHEILAVPADAFACEHYRSTKSFKTWLSKKVVLWGIVKEQGASNGKACKSLNLLPRRSYFASGRRSDHEDLGIRLEDSIGKSVSILERNLIRKEQRFSKDKEEKNCK